MKNGGNIPPFSFEFAKMDPRFSIYKICPIQEADSSFEVQF